MSVLDLAIDATTNYIEQMPKNQRKKYGQFFTSKETAVFMANLFHISDQWQEISILDPGAGSGILSIALLDRLETFPNINKINITCYENNADVIDLLKNNLSIVARQSRKQIEVHVICDNYILSQEADYGFLLTANPAPDKYDLIIGNPPYMKIAKNAPEALAMSNVCYGAPNLYFLFASMSLFNLKENGEMVYIIPRSWTSGAYFKRFRQNFLSQCVLEHIHLFISRDKVFEKENVLQETLIVKAKKSRIIPETVTITTTKDNSDFSQKTIFEAPYSSIVRGSDYYIYLVTNSEEANILNRLNKWKNTLPDIGLKMKTGLIVDFRNRDLLRDKAENSAIPLFYSQHIQNGKVVFPIKKNGEYLVTNQIGLIQRNSNYLFVKRFTAKEEKRRLQCGIYLSKEYPTYEYISTQNKINFICGKEDLSEPVVYGLYVLFNSSVYDQYYRILNGSTQVNSTEINSMPVPPIDLIEDMGRALMEENDLSECKCDQILERYL